MKLQNIIEHHWYKNISFILTLILLPLSYLFLIISKSRYYCYKIGIFKQSKLRVPVVVIGNISVGGVGKTPLTKHIATSLIECGISVGIILRGYKSNALGTTVVTPDADCQLVGDEALIYAQNNIPVAIGKNRYLAGLQLLKKYPDIKIILTDDGLQHYKLYRDYEIVVIDATRMMGNGYLLPMGPLRESVTRLKTVDAIVVNTSNIEELRNKYKLSQNILVTSQKLVLQDVYNPISCVSQQPSYFVNKNVVAISAIGNPQKFFDFLQTNKIKLDKKIAFPDHYYFKEKDIPDNYDLILVTEKDYVKLSHFNNAKIWVVRVNIELDSNKLINQIIKIPSLL
ncbi:MAG: tetraacyldisaccharide 4'-kinase [Proteobacteria bacterium]|nr:tetraacyldisaccharide 4'-kinase [Pseudomonadota bacterium]